MLPDMHADLAIAILAWYRGARRDLPWRRLQTDPYAVWVAEVMLQQTQVATVVPYYARWMERFPTLQALADAPEEDVLRLWSGLGYYARARNLRRAAREVAEHYGGVVPSAESALRALPGVGPYTAAAIRATAFDTPAAVVDTNVSRVVSRVFALDVDPKSPRGAERIASGVSRVVAGHSPREASQALMELGALVCIAGDPACDRCPALRWCIAGNSPDPTEWPRRAARKAAVRVTHACSAIPRDGCLLMARRPPHGLWGGLWEMPRRVCASGETPERCAVRAAAEVSGIGASPVGRIGVVRHTVTHHAITLHIVRCEPTGGQPTPEDSDKSRWTRLEDLELLPLSSPQRAAIDLVLRQVGKRRTPNPE
jgi:A/G-specific adenine glycosylase